MTQTKIFGVFALSIIVSLILISGVYAVDANASVSIVKVSNGIIRVTANSNLSSAVDLSSSPSGLVFTPASLSLPVMGNSANVNVSLDGAKIKFGDNSFAINANYAGTQIGTLNYVVSQTFCKNGSAGSSDYQIEINSIDISNKGSGEDDSWDLLDKVEVKVEVENTGNENLKSVYVKLGLYDSSGKNVAGDLEFSNTDEELIEIGSLNSGKNEEVTFTFVIPADFEDSDYMLAVKTYSSSKGEANVCADSSGDLSNEIYNSVSVNRQSDEGKYISFQNIEVMPTEATCGGVVTVTADVYNVGDEDQDRVKVNLYNKELGINTDVEITSGLDMGDKESVTFDVTVPNGAIDKTYNMELSSSYDYRSGSYHQDSDTSEDFPLKVLGCSGVPSGSKLVSITAALGSETKAGQELIIKSTITNLASQYTSFVISASDYESWSELTSISDRIVGLNPGESRDVTFKFMVNKDTSDAQTFAIKAQSGSAVETRDVEVNFGAAPATGGIGGLNFGNNSLIWVIGAINVILIILIIIVAVRISRR